MLTTETDRSKALAKVSHYLRMAIRAHSGEREDEEVAEDSCEGRGYNVTAPSEDLALEREIELARLETENEELRFLVRLAQGTTTEEDESRHIGATRHAHVSFHRKSIAGQSAFLQPQHLQR